MPRTVILSSRTERDIHSAYTWYESRQSGLGEEFLHRLRKKLETIRRQPESSQFIHKNIRRAILSRFLTSFSVFPNHPAYVTEFCHPAPTINTSGPFQALQR
jgi:plasmid stabilization system protein ParE